MKHQLKNQTYCVPKDKEQCIEMLRIAESMGMILTDSYTSAVLIGEYDWPASHSEKPKAVSYLHGYIYAFANNSEEEIPVEEFIARLKGQYLEQQHT